ncbi:hypothetical protein [Shimia ponticola]|uniref:hypothetical protein n=1 Tax=Shimia ponticola TaxID=2582893 RepID=UPI0011BF16F3|nr:hypothetical protein [Shimia ponticola]
MKEFFRSFSHAERLSLVALALIILVGAVVGLWAFDDLQPIVDTSQPVWGILWKIAAAMCSAGIAARSATRFFGGRGPVGTARAVFGAVVGTLAFGVLGGTLILPIFGTMFAPWFVVLTLFKQPILGVLWALAWTAFAIARIRYEDERDTIFTARSSAYADVT